MAGRPAVRGLRHRLATGCRGGAVAAALADGVLTVAVPKAETDKPRRIQVTAG